MIGQGAVGWKKRNARMNTRLVAGVGVNGKLGRGRGTLQRVSGDVLRVVKLLYGNRVMAGSEAQFLDDEAYGAKLVTLLPEVEILASYSAKPLGLVYGRSLTHIRRFF